MRCEFCQASGLSISSSVVVPCVECGGFGTLHPCEGLRAQPFDETSQVINELEMIRMLDWATRSNQRLTNRFIQYLKNEDTLISWKSVALDHSSRERIYLSNVR